MSKTWPRHSTLPSLQPSLALLPVLMLGACSTQPLVQGPMLAAPVKAPLYLERPNNGAIYQAHMPANSLFSSERRPQSIGDTLKVDIAESLQASQRSSSDTSRDNKLAVKGPGSGRKSGGVLETILNADASASGSDSFKGSGNTETSSSFATQLAVTVINVLPNGHLVVAGERSTGLNGGRNTLRFSGTLDPRDIRPGNIVNSKDVVNASLENVGQGDVSEASSRTWLQRVLTRSLSIW
ncbi:flagellar basal body L-ring protein FlgH [Roseateles microcysteis]|uniref:flagellar basal body L-ring protein FlgH n=1 Tax=Roseateles microcysteis TaxID=3119057 RepID=UPI002FE6108E